MDGLDRAWIRTASALFDSIVERGCEYHALHLLLYECLGRYWRPLLGTLKAKATLSECRVKPSVLVNHAKDRDNNRAQSMLLLVRARAWMVASACFCASLARVCGGDESCNHQTCISRRRMHGSSDGDFALQNAPEGQCVSNPSVDERAPYQNLTSQYYPVPRPKPQAPSVLRSSGIHCIVHAPMSRPLLLMLPLLLAAAPLATLAAKVRLRVCCVCTYC